MTTTDFTTYTATQQSSIACPIFTYNALVQFVIDYKWIFGSIVLAVGIFLAFFGRKLFTVAIFIVGTVVVAFLILIIFYSTFLSDKT